MRPRRAAEEALPCVCRVTWGSSGRPLPQLPCFPLTAAAHILLFCAHLPRLLGKMQGPHTPAACLRPSWHTQSHKKVLQQDECASLRGPLPGLRHGLSWGRQKISVTVVLYCQTSVQLLRGLPPTTIPSLSSHCVTVFSVTMLRAPCGAAACPVHNHSALVWIDISSTFFCLSHYPIWSPSTRAL